jgi:leucyl-tRNA synthetase
MKKYNHEKIEKKWQDIWGKYAFNNEGKKFYNLVMFPYPSGDLHVGHWYNFALSDAYSRFMRLKGHNVFQPIGFDSFGLPAENAAIKRGLDPKEWTYSNINNMKSQLIKTGALWNWDSMVVTSDPSYYKWTQWLFLKFLEEDLAYKAEAPVNWCPSCKTVLANEQVVGGLCERCDSEVEQKYLSQWFYRITKYAQPLLEDLDKINWPEKIKTMQRNWIGRSEGAQITFKSSIANNIKDRIEGEEVFIPVFTTRPDTIFGTTYLVMAPENPLVPVLTTPDNKEAVADYIEKTKKVDPLERTFEGREKTGVFLGSTAINPATGKKIPIWISDYVLTGYGTGAIMAVPAHDQRDYDFAKKFGLEIVEVIKPEDQEARQKATFQSYDGPGLLINSADFSGITSEDAKIKITDWLEEKGSASKKINYRLRDWLLSRQRYWGAPIPIIYCSKCGMVPVPEKDLPVILPSDVKFKPTGESPLKDAQDWVNVKCPKCGDDAKRETDTMDTFVCSSWYYLRYCDPNNDSAVFDTNKINEMLPVDQYIGGAEHAVMHLLYVRFFAKALKSMGLINFEEPIPNYFAQGTILGPNGLKMSKSRGNVIDPDKVVEEVGADTVRAYLAFMGPYDQGGPWNPDSVKGVHKFLSRLNSFSTKISETDSEQVSRPSSKIEEKEVLLLKKVSQAVKKAEGYYKGFKFNLVVALSMETLNFMEGCLNDLEPSRAKAAYIEALRMYLIMISPLVPHLAEEIWHKLGSVGSLLEAKWPEIDQSLIAEDEYNLVIQVNGKLRDEVTVSLGLNEEEILQLVYSLPKITKWIEDKKVVKHIFVPGKLINLVVK